MKEDQGSAAEKPLILLFYRNLELGGVQHMMVMLANGLAARGHRVELVVGNAVSPFRTELSQDVRLVDLNAPGIFGLISKLTRYLRVVTPAVVFTAVPNCNTAALIARAASFSNARVVISERSATIPEFSNSPWGLYKLSMLFIPLTYRLADRIVAVSAGTAESLVRFARIRRDKIDVIYNPAFNDEIVRLAAEPVSHRWMNGQHRVVVSAGRLRPQKDYETLIRAAAIVHSSEPDVKFVILGEGPDRSSLEALKNQLGLDAVLDMPGADPNPFRWFGKSDVFALSSKWEGFGNVLVQALACGCSVVSTDCPSGPREILGDGRFGLLTPVADPEAMANGILTKLRSPDVRSDMLARAREFSVENAVVKYEELFGLGAHTP